MAPINKHLETDLENVHSLPNIEEARTQNIMASGGNRYSGKKKRMIALIVVLVAVIATAIGFTVAGTQNKRAQDEANSLASNENGEENDDVERFEQVKTLLTDGGITSATEFQQPTSPQYKAAAWISNDDELEMDIPASIDEDSYLFVQRYVMAVFYYALGGENWINTASFLTGEDTCDWSFDIVLDFTVPGSNIDQYDYGVSCWDEEDGEYGDAVTWIFMRTLSINCTRGNHLERDDLCILLYFPRCSFSHIIVASNNLLGTLPSEIGALEALSHLSLFQNKIVGPIPESFQNLEFLNFWAMESNKIDGPLPSWIGELEYLEYLALGDNSLSGELPSFLNSNLLELALDTNMFEGSIESLNDATSLIYVYLNNNRFSGAITETTWEKLVNMDLLVADLSNNMLSGTFPANFYWLEEIDLSDNKLTGIAVPLDDQEEEDFPVEIISLANNKLVGKIPNNIDQLAFLVSFDVSDNTLTGEIPTQFGKLGNLESLYLSNNPKLAGGPIPDLNRCQALTEVSMANTNRDGNIPEWFGSALSDLELLDLHDNQLASTMPTNLGSLQELSVLLLNRNKLTGDVPSQLGGLESLGTLDMLGIIEGYDVPMYCLYVFANCYFYYSHSLFVKKNI